MFYDYFAELCKHKGTSVSKACEDMGLSRAVAAKWKSTNTNPRMDTVKKISDYFGITVDSLLMRELPDGSEATQKSRINIQSENKITEDELQQIKQFAEFVTKGKVVITLDNCSPKPLDDVKAKLEALNKAILDFEAPDQEEAEMTS